MENSLDSFLAQARTEGEQVPDEGFFSLSREQVLKKMASYSFPFKGAWLVRTVQALVAGGAQRFIEAKLLKEKVVVEADFKAAWSLDSIEEAFFAPHLRADRGLHFLRTTLWFLGLAERREFWLHIPGQSDVLYWSGTEFRRFPGENQSKGFKFVVSHFRYNESLPTFGSSPKAIEQNASLLHAATNRLFACPVPLRVDGRRLDSLFSSALSGHRVRLFPVALGVTDAPTLPTFKIPPGTAQGPMAREFPRTKGISSSRNLADRDVSIAWVVNAGGLQREEGWKPAPTPSYLHWILDGAELQRTELPSSLTCCVSVFASAESLNFDVSGFGISEDAARRQRMRDVITTLSSIGQVCTPEDFQAVEPDSEIARRIQSAGRSVGNFLAGLARDKASIGFLTDLLKTEDISAVLSSAKEDAYKLRFSVFLATLSENS